jgi:methylglyoxal synthase
MKIKKRIALVAHDNRNKDLSEWVDFNFQTLLEHQIIATGTTGRMLEEALNLKISEGNSKQMPVNIVKLKSGPLGGDQQLGAMIAENKIDVLIFFWDPMEPQPHDVDVKALLRISAVYNIPVACNRSTADFIISSPLIAEPYSQQLKDYSVYLKRKVEL